VIRTCFDFPGIKYPGMSQVVRTSEWILVSGQLAMEDGVLVGKDDPHAQSLQCFKNISAALSLAGAGLEDIVKLTCYVTDRSGYAAYAAAKTKLFASQAPAGTTVIVAGLLVPGALLEVDALAFAGHGQ
jgi:enamine deaminase RidA (YjgF/YER057c/UK114 family)